MRAWMTMSLALMLGGSAVAHDFWIEPSTFEPAAGAAIRVHLRVGERFAGETVARDESRIEQFFAAGPSGRKPVAGRDGMDPAGLLRLDEPGLWLVGYRSRPAPVVLGPEAFEAYLREEGLERVAEERVRRGEQRAPGREIFSRSVKALLRVGGRGPAAGCDRPLGLTLELVPGTDPLSAPDGRLPLTLLFDGRPLEGALVVALRKAALAPGEGEIAASQRTDRDGRVTIPVSPGVWLVKAVHMERAKPATGADWESVWTSLTFDIPAHRPAPR
jgi:uncharacterized GH25 family protein